MNEIDLNKAMQTSGVFITPFSQREYLRLVLTQDDNEASFCISFWMNWKASKNVHRLCNSNIALALTFLQSHSPVNYRKQINCKLFSFILADLVNRLIFKLVNNDWLRQIQKFQSSKGRSRFVGNKGNCEISSCFKNCFLLPATVATMLIRQSMNSPVDIFENFVGCVRLLITYVNG